MIFIIKPIPFFSSLLPRWSSSLHVLFSVHVNVCLLYVWTLSDSYSCNCKLCTCARSCWRMCLHLLHPFFFSVFFPVELAPPENCRIQGGARVFKQVLVLTSRLCLATPRDSSNDTEWRSRITCLLTAHAWDTCHLYCRTESAAAHCKMLEGQRDSLLRQWRKSLILELDL